jgi:hypothetical protein
MMTLNRLAMRAWVRLRGAPGRSRASRIGFAGVSAAPLALWCRGDILLVLREREEQG